MVYNIDMSLESDLFQYFSPQYDKLLDYGFTKENYGYFYSCPIKNGQFIVHLTVDHQGHVNGKVYDSELDEEYVLFRNNITNNFASEVRAEYIELLKDVALNCFKATPFSSNQGNMINDYIYQTYSDTTDNPFKDFQGAVLRNHNNKKWYGLIMSIQADKLLHNNDESLIEVLNVKVKPDNLNEYLKINGIYPAYHMNKKNWISIILDSTVDFNIITHLIDESYNLTESRNPNLAESDWLIPANPKYFDVVEAFKQSSSLTWPARKRMKVNDNVYIYYSAPYSSIVLKAIVTNVDEDKYTTIELVEFYDKDRYLLKELKEHGINTVRFMTRIPKSVKEYLNEK